MVKDYSSIYRTGNDQGTDEIIRIVRDMRQIEIEIVEDQHGNRFYGTDAETMAFINGMIHMITLMGPAGDHLTREHRALLQLQRLIYGNLGCVEPKLQPYDEVSMEPDRRFKR